MSYLVLARKYRSQTFSDVVGQKHVTQTLENAIRQDRVAHAFLFTGSRGVGKTSTARILAKAMNCVHGPTPTPCNECAQCGEITEGRSVDVIEIDGASNRGINEIREVREAVRYAPSSGRYKVYIIDEVHMLTTEAFNALLKTLEEPPSHAIFVFATTEPNKIPVTILSRCQRYDFKRIGLCDIVAHLEDIAAAEGLSFADDALMLLARHARGGMRDALSAMDQVIAFATTTGISADDVATILGVASRRHLLEIGAALVGGDVSTALRILDHVDGFGQDLVHFSIELLHHLRDMTVVRAVADARSITDLGEAEFEQVRTVVEPVPVAQLQRMFQLFAEALDGIARSQFPRLLLEMALVKLAGVEPLVPLDLLVGKLGRLEQALSGGEIADDVLERYRELLAELTPRPAPEPAGSNGHSADLGERSAAPSARDLRERRASGAGLTVREETIPEPPPPPPRQEPEAPAPADEEPARAEDVATGPALPAPPRRSPTAPEVEAPPVESSDRGASGASDGTDAATEPESARETVSSIAEPGALDASEASDSAAASDASAIDPRPTSEREAASQPAALDSGPDPADAARPTEPNESDDERSADSVSAVDPEPESTAEGDGPEDTDPQTADEVQTKSDDAPELDRGTALVPEPGAAGIDDAHSDPTADAESEPIDGDVDKASTLRVATSADAALLQSWKGILDRLDSVRLANVLSHAVLTALSAQKLEFWLPESYVALLEDADFEELAEVAGDHLEGNPRVRAFSGKEPPSHGAASLDSRREAKRQAALEAKRRSIEEDPLLAAAMETFGVPLEQVSIRLEDEEYGR